MATGMDDFGIFFSDPVNATGQPEGDLSMLKRRFREFLREFRDNNSAYIYRQELERAVTVKSNHISVELGDISAYDPQLAESITKKPTTTFEILEEAAKQVADEVTRPRPGGEPIDQDLHVQLNSGAEARSIRDLTAADVGKLVKVPGIAVSASQVKSKASVLSLRCRSCAHAKSNIKIRPGLEGYALPRKCEAEASASRDPCPLDPYILVPELCQCRDFQNVKIQESPDSIPTAEMPRHVGMYMERSLVDKVVPGNRVTVTGIYQIRREQVKGPRARDSKKSGVGIRAAYIRVLGVEVDQTGPGRANEKRRFSRDEEEAFRLLAQRPDIYDLISKSIAPSIYGCEDIKRSVACLLFGGSRKRLPDGNRRGDINVLMLGDPGTAKSQLLKFAERCAPVGVYTSGKGSSAAGLTAAVVRDQNRGFALEAGAMVLADGGLVCIDEFDKMRPEDRVAIHEAMEQQTISIAKAGLTTTLNSRCSVLAAANSVYGRWDDTKGEENIDFLPTILSRFDMIYVVKDVHDATRDATLAKYVMNVHTGAATQSNEDKDEIDLETLKKYIQYCRTTCGPRLNGEATKKLQNQYVLMRQGMAEAERSSGKKGAVPITVRQLEAIIRISESLAKIRLAAFATGDDVTEALRLFRTSTMQAASTGALSGVEGYETASDQEDLNRIERQIRRRFLVGSQVSEKSIVTDLTRQNFPERSVAKVLQIMIRRGEIQHRMQRRMLYRVK